MKQFLVAALLVTSIVPGHANHSIPDNEIIRSEGAIPFESGKVERAGERVIIRWNARGSGKVQLVASADPIQLEETKELGWGEENGIIDIALPRRADGKRWFVHLIPTRGLPLVLAERNFDLKTAPNFRDLGGYRTVDGRWVRMGMLFRSDQLNLLSDTDLARISSTGISTVADLRTAIEREREPDRIPSNAQQLIFDMSAGLDPAPFMAALARGDSRDAMLGVYRHFPSSSATAAALNGFLMTVLETEKPILFHCTAGKDRTGWASAVLLSLLGVPREIIIADYLASAELLETKNAAILADVQPPFTADQLRPLLGVERAFIEASFNEVDIRHGSIEAYAQQALKLDAESVGNLRERYLVGAPTR